MMIHPKTNDGEIAKILIAANALFRVNVRHDLQDAGTQFRQPPTIVNAQLNQIFLHPYFNPHGLPVIMK